MDHQKVDFIQCLEKDMALCILGFLDDPADLVRAAAVSRFWGNFVIENGLAKQLCLKKFPKLSQIVGIVDTTKGKIDSVISNSAKELQILQRDQKVYSALLQAITKSTVSIKDCILNAVSASSTDNYPDESIVNTLNPKDRFVRRASYWSSSGQENPDVPETLIYKLRPGIWVISQIEIQPYEAVFQEGQPIYSAKSVRFRIGHPKSLDEFRSYRPLPLQKCAGDKFIWTYTSPEFPMEQENRLQSFKLPEPVLCIGGYIQIELLGRVQRQDEFDGLFYICVCYVRAGGRSVFPAFDIEMVEPHGTVLLKYHPEHLNAILQSPSSDEVPHLRHLEDDMLSERIRLLTDLLQVIEEGPYNRFIWNGGDEDLVL